MLKITRTHLHDSMMDTEVAAEVVDDEYVDVHYCLFYFACYRKNRLLVEIHLNYKQFVD
uniref:Uncharacterized protein n=1 Tax=Schistosoma curassoni TaxID=6186 RepID=A0A183KZ63_9TREM